MKKHDEESYEHVKKPRMAWWKRDQNGEKMLAVGVMCLSARVDSVGACGYMGVHVAVCWVHASASAHHCDTLETRHK